MMPGDVAEHLSQTISDSDQYEDVNVVLVEKDRETKLILAHVVPFNRGDTEWVSEQVCRCPMCTPRSKSWGRTNHDEPRSRRTSSISSDRRRGARSAEPSPEETAE